MRLELRVVTGARAGAKEMFDTPVVTVGRDPASDLHFDPLADLDVSTRHAELRREGGAWSVHDLGSTNGTFVNGERVTTARPLAAGDTISFGANGPTVHVRRLARADTEMRVAEAVRRQTATLRRVVMIGAGALVALGVMGALLWQQRALARERALAALVARSDSAAVRQAALEARVALGDSAAASRRAASNIDFAAIHDRNDAAVAMIASDLDGEFIAGTAFGISAGGLLVTNRHVTRSATGKPARRIRVIYANTTEWLPAHLVRASEGDDLALIQLDRPGRYPVVAGVSRTGERARVGTSVASIGYPLAVDTPMEGTGVHITARTTLTAGTVSKHLDDVLQMDGFAGKGSSGSPVFDARGLVIGVVYGGAAEAEGKIVYAVPSARLVAFLDAK